MSPEHLEGLRLLELCAASPDDPLAIVDGDLQRQRESAQAIRMMTAAAMVPGSSLAH